MLVSYFLVLAAGLVAIGLAGIASHRNFIVIMLGVELILLASTVIVIAFFSGAPNPSGVILLFSIWTVAATEIIALIAFYVFMKTKGFEFDVSRLSRLKW